MLNILKMADLAELAEQQRKLEEHQRLFEEYLQSTKINSTVIKRCDLDEVKRYLISSREGSPCNISVTLKRRIKRNKFVIASFPSDVDCVVKNVQVSSILL